jgi:agmatinase
MEKGTAMAPLNIRKALHSGHMNLFAENGLSIENDRIEDYGDFTISDYSDIEAITLKHLKPENRILTLGGDHSISFPLLKAFQGVYPTIDVLHIDAHADLYDSFEGDPHSHACPFARVMENGLANRLVQVGIRSLNTHQKEQAERFNVEIHQMKDLDLKKIPEFDNPVYISLDMDGLDPAFAPGVSHHEPGGLTSRQVIEIIQNINTELIGADIVEYNPKRDFQNMTAYLAAKMMKEILGKMLEQ